MNIAKYLPLLLAVVSLCGCGVVNNPFGPEPIRTYLQDERKGFDIGRYSFSVALPKRWKASLKPYDQSVSFHFLDQQLGHSSTINVNSYPNNVNFLENVWTDLDEVYLRLKDFYANVLNKNPRIDAWVSRVRKGELTCIREEQYSTAPTVNAVTWTPFTGSQEIGIGYICAVPGQPDRRPIEVGMSQSVGRRAEPFDTEAILDGILASIVFHPDPPPVPKSYRPKQPGFWDKFNQD